MEEMQKEKDDILVYEVVYEMYSRGFEFTPARLGKSFATKFWVEDGKVLNYYGGNRYGQYLKETPTGNLTCLCAAPGTAQLPQGSWLEVVSMSGLQVDMYNDYIGGEIRLAYHHTPEGVLPLTGISFSGSLTDALSKIRFSTESATHGGYHGPVMAVLEDMKIF